MRNPANEQILKDVIKLRDELARTLGYDSYASLDIDDEMADSVDRVQEFLEELQQESDQKCAAEMKEFISELPAGVTLTEGDKMQPWDILYVKNEYKKRHFHLDEAQLAEYFPVEKTLPALLGIYEQFLGLRFVWEEGVRLWDEDVSCVSVRDKSDAVLGYLVLDLFPRPNKYSHAAKLGIVSPQYKDGLRQPALAMVIANFPRPQGDRPALLKRDDVTTFFHEFGHAMHAVLGATQYASFAGTHVKTDFVEVPSQMFEEWMNDSQVLRDISFHYKSGDSLPESTIKAIQRVHTFMTGYFVQRQVALSRFALACFGPGADKDPHALKRKANQDMYKYIAYHDTDHFEVSFGHLMGYGARYYSYLWSKVIALDLFSVIKPEGLYIV